jgi:hypothetical protein
MFHLVQQLACCSCTCLSLLLLLLLLLLLPVPDALTGCPGWPLLPHACCSDLNSLVTYSPSLKD